MLRRLTVILLLSLPVMSTLTAAQSLYVVTANTLNVRSGQGTQYPVKRKHHRAIWWCCCRTLGNRRDRRQAVLCHQPLYR